MWCIRSKNTFGLVGLRTNESSDYWTVTNSIGNESRNIDDLYFWISILYQSHKAIEIRKIFIWFRMPHKKCENLMISYVFKKKNPFNFRFRYIGTTNANVCYKLNGYPFTTDRMYIDLFDATVNNVGYVVSLQD